MELKSDHSVLIEKEGKMRKVLSELDAEQRAVLIYLADLGTALSIAGLVTSAVRFVVNLF